MGRPPGRRNADFEASRADLLDRIVHAVVRDPERSSFAELAEVSGVSRTTLRHYFSSREELLHAMLDHMEVLGKRADAAFADDPSLPLAELLRQALQRLLFAWRVGVGALFVAGLLWGLGDESLGPAYVRTLLEPLLVGFERRLAAHLSGRGMDEVRARHAALALVSPVVLALLHQESLHGVKCRPLDLDAFLADHLASFLRGWVDPADGTPPAAATP